MKKRSYLILFCLLAVLSTLNACPGRKGPDRPPDTIPPAVSDTAPRNLDTNVAPNAAISVTFSEPVLAGTVQFGLALVNGGGSVPCTMSYSGNAAVCTPDQPLEYSTAYQATVSGARDMSGNQMAGEYQWNFTTSASPDTTPPRVVEVQPAKDTTSASSTSAVSIIFSEPMDPTTISESTVLLSTFATGSALVGTVSYNGALSAATFVPGILLAHNTDYLVTVGTNARDLAKNKMTNAFTSRFRTAAADDATPPSVTAMYPAPNAANADVDTPITVTFSEPMSAETITPGNVLVSEGTSTIPIPVDIKLIGTTVVVTPIKPLKFSTVYTVTVPAAVTDLAGHPMATDFASSFTTIAQSPDNVQPYVLSTFPANGDSSVPVYRQVVALFSETMLASSITPATFLLMGPNGIVSGQITVTGALAALTPDQPLDPATQYTAVVTSGVTDLVGNSLTPPAGISWSFTTEPVETHTITATAGSNGHISPSGAITVGYDTSKAFSITPNTGYHIFDVQVDGSSVGSAPTYTFNNVTADHTISAFFQINTYTVTPSAGTNGGINPSVPQTVNYNTTTQFTVTPSAGYNTVMGGTCGGALVGNTYTTNAVKNDCTVTALFSLGTVTVTSSVSGGNGSISPNGAQAVPYGSTPSFTLTPLTGYHASVGGTCGGTLSPDGLTFTTNPAIASCTVIASFSINTFTIATSVSGGTGTVTPVNPSVNSGGNQTISITPGTGYHITDVQVDGSSAGVPTSVTFNNVTTNHTVSALFTLNTLTITSSATGNGTVTPLGPTPVLYGGSQTFTFTPNSPAYVIASVVVDGISQGLPNSWTFNNVTINHTISVTFQLGTNLITATSGTNGTINSNGTIVSAGSSQDFLISSGGTRTFTFVPNTGYLISNVQVDGVSQGAISSYTFTNVMANHTISAFFAAKTVATVTLGSLNQVYNGAPQVATATTTPAGLNVTFTYNGSSTAPTNAGNYAVVGTINDPTYQGSASGTLVISKATATVTLGSLNQTYDGTQKSASATTNPVGLSVTFTYNGLPTAPAVAGNYNVVGTVNDANYQGSAIGTLAIAKAATSVTWANPSAITYGTALSGTQLNATPSVAGNLVYTPASGTILNAGT
ncbi:MAG TPA: Ig-like domain-containing protein, partial [Nitrospirota bacterium]|nr:Ig-like domain-containing protein [Nitrospirota bacterium]